MKVKLHVLEINQSQEKEITLDVLQACGSMPRIAGDKVEDVKVPEGKIWLFPCGSDYRSLEKFIQGQRKSFVVTIL